MTTATLRQHAPATPEGTWLQGTFEASFALVRRTLGEPYSMAVEGEDAKSVVDWAVRFDDGCVVSVYDVACHGRRTPSTISEWTHWHIGGRDAHALAHIDALFGAGTASPDKV